MAQALALTHSSWINAWTLRRACAGFGVDLRVADAARELPLPRLRRLDAAQWIFFTEEASLRRALEGAQSGRFLPEQFPLELLDDKWAFAEFLAVDAQGPQGLAQRPLPAAATARFPVLLKCRHSWVDGRKLPRGWVCRDAADLAARRAGLAAQGMREDWFFLQEWLGDAPLRLLSVGGFFDAADESRNLAVVTERVADYGEGPSSSAMLVTVADEHRLVQRAERVLRRLGYRGPFEMEFIVTAERCVTLELNPRFWMQHGLFLPVGNALVKRYLGRDTEADRGQGPPQRLLWVDGIWLLGRLLRLDRRALSLWRTWVWQRGYRPVVCPSLGFVVRSALWRMCGRRG